MEKRLPQSNAQRRKPRRAIRHERLWVRASNAELDRAGDWLLENLAAVRAHATARAQAR